MKLTPAKIALLLLVAAFILALVGFVIRVVRWLLILAALILLAAGAVHYFGTRGGRQTRT